MLAIRRFVRGSLTLADAGEQLFPLLCAINVPLTSSLPVLLTIEISPAVRPRPGRRFGWKSEHRPGAVAQERPRQVRSILLRHVAVAADATLTGAPIFRPSSGFRRVF
jgi:hypothetical protein